MLMPSAVGSRTCEDQLCNADTSSHTQCEFPVPQDWGSRATTQQLKNTEHQEVWKERKSLKIFSCACRAVMSPEELVPGACDST